MVNQTAKISKEEARAIYIESVLDRIRFVDRFAHVPSSDGHKEYVVVLQNGFVTKCSCPDFTYRHAFCRHMEATKIALYLQSFKAIFAHDEQEETVSLELTMQEAQDEMTQIIEEAAVAGDKTYDEAITAVYDTLGPTKEVSHAYGCCGHIVKAEDAGELCGPCRCK